MRRGFSLIELLVVIAVTAVLTSALMFVVNPVEQIRKARDADRKNDLAQIQRALEQYYSDNNAYPASSGNPDYYIQDSDGAHPFGTSWVPYIRTIPADPDSSMRYRYVTSDGQSYALYANLERGTRDASICDPAGGTACSGVPAGVTCGSPTDICNYGVSSPNTSP